MASAMASRVERPASNFESRRRSTFVTFSGSASFGTVWSEGSFAYMRRTCRQVPSSSTSWLTAVPSH